MTQELLEQRQNEAHLRAEGCEWPREGGTRSTSAGTLLSKDAEWETGEYRGNLQPHTLGLPEGRNLPKAPGGSLTPQTPGAVVKEAVRAERLGQESQQCWVLRTLRFFMGVDGDRQWNRQRYDLPPDPARPAQG